MYSPWCTDVHLPVWEIPLYCPIGTIGLELILESMEPIASKFPLIFGKNRSRCRTTVSAAEMKAALSADKFPSCI